MHDGRFVVSCFVVILDLLPRVTTSSERSKSTISDSMDHLNSASLISSSSSHASRTSHVAPHEGTPFRLATFDVNLSMGRCTIVSLQRTGSANRERTLNMAESRQDIYEVNVENGDTISYEIRGLRDEKEIESWAAFCASVFSYKANPPPASYFERHYRNDPTRSPSLVRVALYQGQIVASCRLFLREVSTGDGTGSSLSAGGIGEVCTADDHRRRGLSKVLLRNVIEIMQERRLQVSLLHAAPAFFPVYEKAGGYVCTTSSWSVVPISTADERMTSTITTSASTSSAVPTTIRKASFPNDTERLSHLHRIYSEQRFAGCILRSTDYWNDYLSIELQGSLWVLEVGGTVVSWLSLRSRGDRFQLREFGFDQNCSVTGITTSTALSTLLAHAIKELPTSSEDDDDDDSRLLAVPTFLLDECRSRGGEESLPHIDWPKLTNDDDLGWMYKILDERIVIASIDGSQTPHLIWPADSF